jgi:hypothetical protein
MGQQQLLLIILGVIIVGIAIAVGLSLFAANSVQANKDAIVNDINNLAANAYQYYIRPASMAGGASDYTKYTVPFKMSSNDNATYVASAGSTTSLTFTGTSHTNSGTVVGKVDNLGKVTFDPSTGFTGDFK